jgi:glyoxylase-like metal-dependent hydrolase (beta-lactamase superfamily II)
VDTDLGQWQVIETPGHAPSHICLYQPERRLLISGDHLLGRVSLYFDAGHTPDPVGEFLASLDKVEGLSSRLALAGHGRPFADVRAHIVANRALVAERLAAVRAAVAGGPRTAYEIAQEVYGELFTEATATWLLSKTRSYLTHLEQQGLAVRAGESPERWSAAA